MNLAIVVPRFNPCGYARPLHNFEVCITSMLAQIDPLAVFIIEANHSHKVVSVAEVQLGRQEVTFADDRHFCWQKEALINKIIRELPAEFDAACWVDSDLLFDNPDWYEQTCLALEEYPVVQAFEKIAYLGPDDEYQSGGYGTAAAGSRLGFRAPGGAIACRRELLDHGIYDRHVLGGGDEIFMDACLGLARRFYERLNPAWKQHVQHWCEDFGQHDVGYIPGTVRHLWHGNREGRQYGFRHQLLASHDFDPETDVRVGANGLLEWSSDKPALHAAVRDYFRGRAEDQITASVS